MGNLKVFALVNANLKVLTQFHRAFKEVAHQSLQWKTLHA